MIMVQYIGAFVILSMIALVDIMGKLHARRVGKNNSFYRGCDLTLNVLLLIGAVTIYCEIIKLY